MPTHRRRGGGEGPGDGAFRLRFWWLVVLLTAATGSFAATIEGEQPVLLRIGTGGERGTYFPIGSLLARAFTGRTEDCEEGSACGVSGLLAVAQLSNGSVANVEAITAGAIDAGLVQADVAYWAHTGTGIFTDKAGHTRLRAIANLYPESIHVVARKGSGIRSIGDLRGRRVSLDELGSGTLVDARIILDAHGLEEADLHPIYVKPQFAAAKIGRGELDAFFIVAGYPTSSVAALAAATGADLVPIERAVVDSITRRYRFFSPSVIPAGVYTGIPQTQTLSVGAQLLTSADLDDELVYSITRELWAERTRRVLIEGHPAGKEIVLRNALQGLAIPLHPGAERFYREAGMLAQ